MNQNNGIVIIVSAPSGAGKTTVCQELYRRLDDLVPSVSYTTRAPRVNEIDGEDYHFVTSPQFKGMIENDAFVEWAQVHGNYYGTSFSTLENVKNSGKSILLEIDCQGALQLREKLPDAVYIFIAPPSYDELERRLRHRNTDSEEVIKLRLENARGELRQLKWYDYVVINEDIDEAIALTETIIVAEKVKTDRLIDSLTKIFDLHEE